MQNLYYVLLIILAILAISDLIVGVSNDAVNFLGSAIGAKVASLKTIMLIAAAGIIFGASFSGGMMEVARKGIYNPSVFYFNEIILICLAVMIADILLLDIFNTFGLPTSTTVSIVFDLLGAAFGIAILKIAQAGGSFSEMNHYINAGKSLTIISGILVSIVIAFSVGAIVQYISRIVFSFNLKKTLPYFGSIWGGISLTVITYFLVIKGAKDVSFISEETYNMLQHNTSLIMLGSFILWTIVLQLLLWAFNFNILKFVVLTGTFSLAMAFAGNDLVNFIGVPLAGYEAYKIFIATPGATPDGLLMGSLQGEVQTPTILLMIAGIIMAMTLWLSKKARTVIKTSLKLSEQESTFERFESNILARSLVRQTVNFSKTINKMIPSSAGKWMEKRFDIKPFNKYAKQNPGISFDHVRASVNLVVASILIASATSLKLPLSTTYVTFMVAMGTSLADGAWGRESAVFRISGVITVIGGWFFTAISAFTVAFIVAMFLFKGGLIAIIILIVLSTFLMIKSHLIHKKKTDEECKEEDRIRILTAENNDIFEISTNNVITLLLGASKTFEQSVKALSDEKRKKLKENIKDTKLLTKETKSLKKDIPKILERLDKESIETGHHYIEVTDYLREIVRSLCRIVEPAYEHVNNNHSPLNKFQISSLKELSHNTSLFQKEIISALNNGNIDNKLALSEKYAEITDQISKIRKKHLKQISKEPGSARTNMLFLDILSEAKSIVQYSYSVNKSFRDFILSDKIYLFHGIAGLENN